LAKYSNQTEEVDVEVVGLSKKQDEYFRLIERDGFIVNCFNSIKGVINFFKAERKRIDLVHMHNVWTYQNDILARVLIRLNIPYVISVHSGFSQDRINRSNKFLKVFYQKYIQSYTLNNALAIHATVHEECLDIAMFTNNKVFVIPNGVDLEYFNKPRGNKDTEISRAVFVGRNAKEKNIEGLLRAISLLPTEYKNRIKLDLVCPVSDSLVKLIDELNINPQVELCGELYGKDRDEKLLNSDFYVHPALSDVCPTGLVSAWAFGLPSVVSRTSGVIYFQKNHKFIMVEPVDRGIMNGIKEMLDSREHWQEYSDSAKSIVTKQLNWSVIAENLVYEYKSLIQINIE
jgi:glycosyltransferase involved in cell wall biosynthesis